MRLLCFVVTGVFAAIAAYQAARGNFFLASFDGGIAGLYAWGAERAKTGEGA